MRILPNDNVFIGWSKQGYMSEFTRSGRNVMDAAFVSNRFNSYRVFKSNFTAYPLELPVLRAFAYGTDPSSAVTTVFVSWNGATEVKSWNFYDGSISSSVEVPVGTMKKDGFETMFTFSGVLEMVWAEALDKDGRALGKTNMEKTTIPAILENSLRFQNVHQEWSQGVGPGFHWGPSSIDTFSAPLIVPLSSGVLLLYVTFKSRHRFGRILLTLRQNL